jgi:tRNA G18 (ribose-2'-O)-methylase SpoU
MPRSGSIAAPISACTRSAFAFGVNRNTLAKTSYAPIAPVASTRLRCGSMTNLSANSALPSGRDAATAAE